MEWKLYLDLQYMCNELVYIAILISMGLPYQENNILFVSTAHPIKFKASTNVNDTIP